MVKFVDWFAGIGGFRYGLERANEKEGVLRQSDLHRYCPNPNECREPDRKTPGRNWGKKSDNNREFLQETPKGKAIQGQKPIIKERQAWFDCVGACEIDRWCRRIYAKNFGHEPEWADSRAVDPAELPDFDLFCAGFPCQAFSIAGKRRGFDDTRGTLFFEICRIVGVKRPWLLLLENVKGLLSHGKGKTFLTILESLDELGYDCQWEVLNSKNFGVPQNRERVFIVGHLRGKPRPQVFPLGENAELANGPSGEEGQDIAITLRAHQSGGVGDAEMNLVFDAYNQRVGELPTTIRQNMGNSGPLVLTQDRHELRIHHTPGEVPTLKERLGTGGNNAPIIIQKGLRRLTPLECERLQGFPDGWTEGVSDTQRYKMLGNAVTTTVVKAIGQRLIA